MRPVLHVAAWTWAALLLATVPYALYPVALVYGAGVAELARRYGARIAFWASLAANPYAWLAAFLGVVGFLGPADDMNLGPAIGALSLLFLLLGAAALAVMAWSRRPVWAAGAALLWAVFWPGEALFFGPGAWLTLPLGAGLAYLAWPWRGAARP
ncbi:hypothetical protein Ocepr_0643 [Oceanithermus profundus DSM 14977]|uniref:Uncharacterized protein n=1 Tax=Oceanithermus profundus (strain DSM 14977 / NBRC 100410 / VKM B-2274 / 506) TaxID=670487 RepID=E4U811_OCEP5|nr:hypothetical protein [Oceanithermus profundus]ADR36101.1 hypothetical protein Ocepr_0643 [Oceanithermus profundus DSM 14977]